MKFTMALLAILFTIGCGLNTITPKVAVVELAFNYNPAQINRFDYRLLENGKVLRDVKDARMLDGNTRYVPIVLEPGHCYDIEIVVQSKMRSLRFCPAGGFSYIPVESDGSPLVHMLTYDID